MKKNQFVYIVLALFMFASCEEDTLELEPYQFINPIEDTTSSLGKKINEFYKKYNSVIIYQWDTRTLGGDAFAVPPYYEKVEGFISLLDEVWLKPYHNNEFLKKHLPREILLVGGDINYGENNGSSFGAQGLAESQFRIVIGQVNNFDIAMDSMEYLQYRFNLGKVVHHEFSHILNKIYPIPDEFTQISKGLYLLNTHYSALGLVEALERGFIRTYGGSNEHEDFATMAEAIATFSEEKLMNNMWKILVDRQYAPGEPYEYEDVGIANYEKLLQKYKIVVKYYNDLGIDIQRVGNEIEAFNNDYYNQIIGNK